MEEIQTKQEELGAFEEQKLFNILSKKKNFLLLDNEWLTRRFLAMESRKAGYSEMTWLRYFEVTENKLINSKLHSTFRDIYKLQKNLKLTDTALDDYMNSDGDAAPMEELNKRKLPLHSQKAWKAFWQSKNPPTL